MNLFFNMIEKLYLFLPNNKVYWDKLTGCRTYAYYKDIIVNKYKNKDVVIIYLDCNCLKELNDHYGHEWGNDLLRNVGIELSDLSKKHAVCRMGGDEFLIIASLSFDITSFLHSRKYPHIRQFCAKGFYVKPAGEDVQVGVDIADKRMYENKLQMKNNNCSFNKR